MIILIYRYGYQTIHAPFMFYNFIHIYRKLRNDQMRNQILSHIGTYIKNI